VKSSAMTARHPSVPNLIGLFIVNPPEHHADNMIESNSRGLDSSLFSE
jgi:hypothetical protein